MAISKNNILTYGLRGMIGKQIVFRTMKSGDVIVSASPKKSHNPVSETRLQKRLAFKRAVSYAQKCIKDPKTKADYQAMAKKGKFAYNVAIADYLNPPHINSVDLSKYSGNTGDTISINAQDDFKVVRVHVSIFNPDNTLFEQGEAEPTTSPLIWVYELKQDNPHTNNLRIVVKAFDLPGNETEKIELI